MGSIQLKTALPGPKSKALMSERISHVARGPFHTTPIFVARAEGAVLEDVDGNHLLDFAAGIGVLNIGHTANAVVQAVQEQASLFTHASINVTPYESYVRVCEKLNALTPGKFKKKSCLFNSGAEAVENAIKIARAFTRRQAVICFDHAFHGRTYMAMTLTSKAKPYKTGFGPFNPEVYRAPFPYAYRWPNTGEKGTNEKIPPAKISEECFKQFEELVNARVCPTEVAAVIIEPVLGEGGFIPAPPEFLARLRKFCSDHQIVFIADEIQTGFGRTGSLFACEQLGIEPDLMVTAKGLGGGLPLSAVTGKAEIMDGPIEGGIGGTYSGNPIACAAALSVFESFADGTLLSNARALGETLQRRLRMWHEKFKHIGDIRGLGPMLAMELVKDQKTKEPFPEAAKAIVKSCSERGVVLMSAGTFGNVLRFLMPLTMTQAQLNEGLEVVEGALGEAK